MGEMGMGVLTERRAKPVGRSDPQRIRRSIVVKNGREYTREDRGGKRFSPGPAALPRRPCQRVKILLILERTLLATDPRLT
jgi:hypothetical protein